MAETELRCHPWLLDSANPWRNDGSGLNKYTDGTISVTPTWTPRFVENYPRIFLKSQNFQSVISSVARNLLA
uniref:Uncharacterized protein n=1 Tax=Candidatus Kentrum sp. LFY TaxID=2126342 RepID=A0A450WGC8_9GAMM|nr:MAG: hypothetical protein BECKLFY1418C_GA0070996_102117 [Candidatus Kentron sp. LFY]